VIFHLFSPEAPHERISTKFCTAMAVMDVITCAKFFSDRLRDVNSVSGQTWRFPLTKPMAVNTGLAQSRRLWFSCPWAIL